MLLAANLTEASQDPFFPLEDGLRESWRDGSHAEEDRDEYMRSGALQDRLTALQKVGTN